MLVMLDDSRNNCWGRLVTSGDSVSLVNYCPGRNWIGGTAELLLLASSLADGIVGVIVSVGDSLAARDFIEVCNTVVCSSSWPEAEVN